MSIIDVNVIVPWAFKRGRWCRDCHNTWRNKHSQEHTLVMFAKWLKCLPNKKIFQMNVLAWCSLVAEGHTRITGAVIAQRVEM